MMTPDIRIVLIQTSHPGNIGSAARAMKTMGLSQLYLVNPLDFPHPKALEMASGADDIVNQAIVVNDLAHAIGDCTFVAGTSARARTIPWPMQSPRELAESIYKTPQKVALLFGREQSGLSNEELQRCHVHTQIPANPDYSSLNLASAVQVLAYELRVASLAQLPITPAWDYPPATVEAMENFYQHLESVMVATTFLNPKVPRQLMTRLRRLFNRAQPDSMEINILRGILASVANALRSAEK